MGGFYMRDEAAPAYVVIDGEGLNPYGVNAYYVLEPGSATRRRIYPSREAALPYMREIGLEHTISAAECGEQCADTDGMAAVKDRIIVRRCGCSGASVNY